MLHRASGRHVHDHRQRPKKLQRMLMLAQTARAGVRPVGELERKRPRCDPPGGDVFEVHAEPVLHRARGWPALHEKMNVPLVMNRWGASEPAEAALRKAPEALRQGDQRCRTANDLSAEPCPGQ